MSDLNVLAFDWASMAGSLDYFESAADAVRVGEELGETLAKVLILDLNVDPSNVHAIGHSLGAHVAGQMGRKMEALGGKGKIARITGKYQRAQIKSTTV